MLKKCVHAATGICTLAVVFLCVCSPTLAVALVPLVCISVYFFGRRWGAWTPAVAAAVYVVAGILFRGVNALWIAGAALVLSLTVPLLCRRKLSLWAELGVCGGTGLFAVCAVFCVFALATEQSLFDVALSSCEKLATDPVFYALASHYYGKQTAESLGHIPLLATDPQYVTDVVATFVAHIGNEAEGYVLWYLTGYGVFASSVACAVTHAVAQCLPEYDGKVKMRDLRLGRTYVLAVFLPVIAVAFLAFYEPMQPAVRMLVNCAVTLPTSLCGITLLYHTLCRISGKGGIVARVAFWLVIAISLAFYDWALLVFGFVGLADAILNVRKLLDWALG